MKLGVAAKQICFAATIGVSEFEWLVSTGV